MSRDPTPLLEALIAATEAAWDACERGDASIEQLAELVRERQRCFDRLDAPAMVSAQQRALATRLAELDQRLLAWCAERQGELARALAHLPRRSHDAHASDGRMLSDVA